MDVANRKGGYRIAQLDGWRGISILFVIVGHTITFRHFDYYGIAGVMADTGVKIFFVISGFIITKLALREINQTGDYSIRNFYTRRFFRIVPPFFLYLAFIVLAGTCSLIRQRNSETLTAITFACNLPNVNCSFFAAHSWSLAYEEQFYIVFPLLLTLVAHHVKKFIIVLLFALAIFMIFGFVWPEIGKFAFGFFYIFAGVVIAAYETEIQQFVESRRVIYVSFGAALILMGSPWLGLDVSLCNVISAICIAWLVGSSVYQTNFFSRALTWPPLLFVGTISYSLYLWQQLFVAPHSMYISDGPLLFTPLVFVVATLSYYLVERPGTRLGKYLIDRRAHARVRATTLVAS